MGEGGLEGAPLERIAQAGGGVITPVPLLFLGFAEGGAGTEVKARLLGELPLPAGCEVVHGGGVAFGIVILDTGEAVLEGQLVVFEMARFNHRRGAKFVEIVVHRRLAFAAGLSVAC